MLVKSFLTGKRGENGIEDSIALDISRGRFAVSDGVTGSFLPQVWSSILSQAWIEIDAVENFPQNDLCEQFAQERNRIMSLLDEDTRMDYEDLEKKYHTASATFCGVELHDNMLKWVVLGDSCLFLLPDGERPQCISSHPMPTDDMGHITPYFDNNPFQILADGRLYGEWTRGERQFEKGTLLLMSDAMSAWFINVHNEDKDPLGQLMALADDEAFEQWVEEQYHLGLLGSDDESVIIIHLDGVTQEMEQMVDTGTTVSTTNNECPEEESPDDVTEDEKMSDGTFNANIQEQTDIIERNPIPKKMHWLRITAFMRLFRMKFRNRQIKTNGSELQTE